MYLRMQDADGNIVKQVLVLRDMAFSFERVDNALEGTHATLSDRQLDLLNQRKDALADEWAVVSAVVS